MAKSVVYLLLLLCINTVRFRSEPTFATLTPGEPMPLNLGLFGYHETIGLRATVPYEKMATSVNLLSLKDALRYPGGTVANYFNITSAQYVTEVDGVSGHCPNIYKKLGHESKCRKWKAIAGFPPQTFSGSRFAAALGRPLTVCLDVLSYKGSEMIQQVDTLREELGPQPLFFEFGNEFYFEKYTWRFSSGKDLCESVAPLAAHIKEHFPGSKVAVPVTINTLLADKTGKLFTAEWFGLPLSVEAGGLEALALQQYDDRTKEWNKLVASCGTHDAVILHDYDVTAELNHRDANGGPKFSESQWDAATLAYATEVVGASVDSLQQLYGHKDVETWWTEFDFGASMHPHRTSSAYLAARKQGPLRGMFNLLHVVAAIEHSDNVKVMMGNGVLLGESLARLTGDGLVELNGVAQMTAHAFAFAKQADDAATRWMHRVSSAGGPTLDKALGGQPVFGRSGLPCVVAAAFSSGDSSSAHAESLRWWIFNRCQEPVVANVGLSLLQKNASASGRNITLNWSFYDASSKDVQTTCHSDQINKASSDSCWVPLPEDGTSFPWSAPLHADVFQHVFAAGLDAVPITMPSMGVAFAEVGLVY